MKVLIIDGVESSFIADRFIIKDNGDYLGITGDFEVIYPVSALGGSMISIADYTPQPVVDVVPVPDEITMRQARLVLLGAGMLGAVESAIAALPEPVKSAAKIEWEYSQVVKRKNGFVEKLAPVIGWSEKQMDDLFIAGSKL